MSENTPKLDLLMKDPVLDGHEYFNVKTMMNDNWEKIDTFAETVDGEVKELQQRLDTEQRKEITLQSGLQIIESDKTVPFRLTGLKGRTLVNLLGRDGNCENINRFTPTRAVLTADTTIKTQGTQSLKITSTGLPTGAATGQSFSVKAGSYYILVGDVKLGSGTYAGPYVSGISNTKNNGNATDTTGFSTIWRAYSALSSAATVSVVSEVAGPVGSVAYFDAIRFYEITAAEYAALDDMNAEQIGAKYPYVDSVKPVRNPYAIRYGGNLLPSFYEWIGPDDSTNGKWSKTGPYEAYTENTDWYPIYVRVPVLKNTTYTLSMKATNLTEGNVSLRSMDANANQIAVIGNPTAFPYMFNSGESMYVQVMIGKRPAASNQRITFKAPMLNIGSEALPFVPREDSMLALQTDLYADPLTGANADSVFERDGQYFKAKTWNRVTLDGSWTWAFGGAPAGVKAVYTNMIAPYNPTLWNPTGVKYDGKILNRTGGADNLSGNAGGTLVQISISNLDSGWGDSYTNLTDDEIKAYFLGWVMYQFVNSGSTPADGPYNGSGTKYWAYRRGDGTYAGGTGTLPTVSAPNWTPYELVYQLATPTVEPIVSEGQLTLNKGSNQVEVGTGIVLRENVQAAKDAGGKWNLGNTAASATAVGFKHMASKVLNVYENGRDDAGWIKASIAQEVTAGGTYNQDAAYTVTYLMREISPVEPFVGSVADNEKSVLLDLVQDVQQAATRVSVLENKKAEKDSPAWITPTLLNSWVNYDGARRPLSFYKDSMGRVHVEGYIKGGIGAFGTVIFQLPEGYRPGKYLEVSAPSYNAINSTPYPSTLFIGSNSVTCDNHVNNGYLVVNFSFLAEN